MPVIEPVVEGSTVARGAGDSPVSLLATIRHRECRRHGENSSFHLAC
jgi:hypothetical protein